MPGHGAVMGMTLERGAPGMRCAPVSTAIELPSRDRLSGTLPVPRLNIQSTLSGPGGDPDQQHQLRRDRRSVADTTPGRGVPRPILDPDGVCSQCAITSNYLFGARTPRKRVARRRPDFLFKDHPASYVMRLFHRRSARSRPRAAQATGLSRWALHRRFPDCGRHEFLADDAKRNYDEISKWSKKDSDASVAWDAGWMGGLSYFLGDALF